MREWIWFTLITVVFWGMAPILDKLGLAKAQPMAAVAIRALVVGIGSFAVLAGTGQLGAVTHLEARTFGLIAAAGICAAFIGQWTYFRALKSGPASAVVPIVASYPLVAACLGVLLLHEPMTLKRGVGAVLVILGVMLVR